MSHVKVLAVLVLVSVLLSAGSVGDSTAIPSIDSCMMAHINYGQASMYYHQFIAIFPPVDCTIPWLDMVAAGHNFDQVCNISN